MNAGDLIAVAITLVFFVGDILLGFFLVAERRDRRALRAHLGVIVAIGDVGVEKDPEETVRCIMALAQRALNGQR